MPNNEKSLDLNELNPAQREAVTHLEGPLLVVAGAGSGKTRVLTHRIAHLIENKGISPFEILAITFTNKAAGEMKSRVADLVGPVAEKMWVSTFHSACVRILRRDAERIGYPSRFSIYDQDDSARLVGYVLKDLNLDTKRFPPRSIQATISALKNEGRTAAHYAESATGPFEERIGRVFTEYQKRLVDAGAMDFDDLLGNTVHLLREDPEVLQTYQERFKHVLVDEYQDTNLTQNALTILLAQSHGNICVVGDSDQSIYQFRGADVRNILDFEKAFPNTTVVVLDQNYRSTQNILDAANAVISQNIGREPKELWTEEGSGTLITKFTATDETEEAKWVTQQIYHLNRNQDHPWSDLAVFYRTNVQSRAIEEQLVRQGIPYRVIGGTRFYDRKEIKDAMAYLRLAANPTDEVAAKRILNVPKRGIGNTSVTRIDQWSTFNGTGFLNALNHAEEAGVTGRALTGINTFIEFHEKLKQKIDDGPSHLLETALEDSGYLQELREEGSIEAEGRIENLIELIGVASEFDNVDEFLEQVALVSDTDGLPDSDKEDSGEVTLMTLHSAKGLEYPVVFLPGMEDGVFPHIRSLGDERQEEEERRLAYVGITRARKHLYVSHAWSRMLHGATQYNPPSRFLKEIPEELVTEAKESQKRISLNDSGWGSEEGNQDDESWLYTDHIAEEEPSGTVYGKRTKKDNSDKTTGAHLLNLQPGEEVLHRAWGEGEIIKITGEGDRAEAIVQFERVGEKRLLLAWAPIERA
ncbi:MAG: DNA helicase PcrA [Acidimicrobiaceae bacterium]|nr:DNA helicase PcrA [Acidimicrobiaceae bacterium]